MKVGITVSIDVAKLDKARFFQGKKGLYCDLTTFVDVDQKDQYENNGFITQSSTKEERDDGVKMPIVGNVKVFYTDGASQAPASNDGVGMNTDLDSDSIPF